MYDGAGFAEAYDLLFGERKNYPEETAMVLEAVRGVVPQARSVLDVACGTGEHLVHLIEDSDQFDRCDGLDLSPEMCRAAKAKLGAKATIHRGDMRDFDLKFRFDAVLCLFSSIGHMRDEAELAAACRCLVRHAAPDGVVVVEPWLFPENMAKARPISQANVNGNVAHDLVEADGKVLVSAGVFTPDVRGASLEMHYLVADEFGVRHFSDQHQYTLFSQECYTVAMRDAGCTEVTFIPPGTTNRGLFVGSAP